MASIKEHIVMLPFMAQGHIIPFLALGRKLHQTTGLTVTICSTPLNTQHLRSSMSDGDSDICLAELAFSSADHGLPPNTENTEFLSHDQMGKFFYASPSLKTPLHKFIQDIIDTEGKLPLCLISDVFFGWAGDVAKDFRIPNFTFSTGGSYGTAAYVSVWLNLPHRTVESEEFTVPGFPEDVLFHVSHMHKFTRAADGNDIWSRFFQSQISASMNSCGWLCNTVKEIEPLGLEVLKNIVKKPVWCVGPLLPTQFLEKISSHNSDVLSTQRAGKHPGISPEKCIQWLDMQCPNSVIYISFGSQNTITSSQMMELAKGLEQTGKPFIWVIRPPVGHDIRGNFKEEWLPVGFQERSRNKMQGLLIHKWAPQLEILSHNSIGAFLSHCGWNSILESLSLGVPIIGWPLAGEQRYNSKMLVEDMGVCVELTKGVEGVIDAKDVKRVIEIAMDCNGKGGEMKKKATEIGQMIRRAVEDHDGELGSSLRALDDFVRTAISKRNE